MKRDYKGALKILDEAIWKMKDTSEKFELANNTINSAQSAINEGVEIELNLVDAQRFLNEAQRFMKVHNYEMALSNAVKSENLVKEIKQTYNEANKAIIEASNKISEGERFFNVENAKELLEKSMIAMKKMHYKQAKKLARDAKKDIDTIKNLRKKAKEALSYIDLQIGYLFKYNIEPSTFKSLQESAKKAFQSENFDSVLSISKKFEDELRVLKEYHMIESIIVCKKCGAKNEDDIIFCTECGWKIQ